MWRSAICFVLSKNPHPQKVWNTPPKTCIRTVLVWETLPETCIRTVLVWETLPKTCIRTVLAWETPSETCIRTVLVWETLPETCIRAVLVWETLPETCIRTVLVWETLPETFIRKVCASNFRRNTITLTENFRLFSQTLYENSGINLDKLTTAHFHTFTIHSPPDALTFNVM